MCQHLVAPSQDTLEYARWYSGRAMHADFICCACAETKEHGREIALRDVCPACLKRIEDENACVRTGGSPEIKERLEPFDVRRSEVRLPKHIGHPLDIAPIEGTGSVWLILTDKGTLARVDGASGDVRAVANVPVQDEEYHEPWGGKSLRRRLHASSCGGFAAVVNDYGHHGVVMDVKHNRATLQLNGGDYYPETVPFSCAFATIRGRVVVAHRTDWNRLDLSDPQTGQCLTDRGPTSYKHGGQRPEHYLDYFHGALRVSPDDRHVLDDGWIWHPIGMPAYWNIDLWLNGNAWESEDGPSKQDICVRDYYWGHGMTWIDEHRIAVSGIGNDDSAMIAGARIFDISRPPVPNTDPTWRADLRWPAEVGTFPGPAGSFFSDGRCLYSTNEAGLSRWNLEDGARTGLIGNCMPSHFHRRVREFAWLDEDRLVRLSLD